MIYPYLKKGNKNLKKKLIMHKIFIATYWPNVDQWLSSDNCFESHLLENLIAIPIDQRYGERQMRKIIDFIKNV